MKEYTVSEYASLKNVSLQYIYKLIKTNKLTHKKIGKSYIVVVDDIDAELEKAIEILEYHQQWRLGERDEMIFEPIQLTWALDIVLIEVKKLTNKE